MGKNKTKGAGNFSPTATAKTHINRFQYSSDIHKKLQRTGIPNAVGYELGSCLLLTLAQPGNKIKFK